MENLSKGDWTDPERVKHFIKTYEVRYGDMFWNTFYKLTETKTLDVIADFRCGPGLWLVDAATRFNSIRLHGLDESEEMLTQAKEIGNLHTELKQLTYNYYLEMKNICSDEQKKKLLMIFKTMTNQGSKMIMPNRNRRNFQN